MTNTNAFFDTNVLVYLLSGDVRKATRSEDLIASGGTISVQVLNECARVLRRKFDLPWSKISELSSDARSMCKVVPLTEETHVLGLGIAERYRLHVYDSMIVAAAQLAGCDMLYSEDMHDGLTIDRLTIRNPFIAS